VTLQERHIEPEAKARLVWQRPATGDLGLSWSASTKQQRFSGSCSSCLWSVAFEVRIALDESLLRAVFACLSIASWCVQFEAHPIHIARTNVKRFQGQVSGVA
jgi:hypothetical protein